jgi:hypothetical protein
MGRGEDSPPEQDIRESESPASPLNPDSRGLNFALEARRLATQKQTIPPQLAPCLSSVTDSLVVDQWLATKLPS